MAAKFVKCASTRGGKSASQLGRLAGSVLINFDLFSTKATLNFIYLP